MNGVAILTDATTAEELARLSTVEAVHPVYQVHAVEPDDSGILYDVVDRETVTVTTLTGVPALHDAGITGEGVTACVVDSGIEYNHAAFGGGGFPNDRLIGGWDFASDDDDPLDVQGHGTHVNGILAGNGDHFVGVAPDAKIRSYKVFNGPLGGTTVAILAAMEQAVIDECDVVNMSLGTTAGPVIQKAPFAKATDRLLLKGVVPVVSAGNTAAGPFLPSIPAVAKKAVAVASSGGEYLSELAFRLSDGTVIPYILSQRVAPPPGSDAGSFELVDYGDMDCAPLPP